MKKALLSFALVFVTFMMYAQCDGYGRCGMDTNSHNSNSSNYGQTVSNFTASQDIDFVVYPNPSVDFIQLDDESVDKGVASTMRIYTVTGQLMKSFSIEKGNSYNISDLKGGIYLVQFLNWKKKVVATKRLNKVESTAF